MSITEEQLIQKAKDMVFDVARFETITSASDAWLRTLAQIVLDALDACQKGEPFHSDELRYASCEQEARKSRLGAVAYAFIVLMRQMEGKMIGLDSREAKSPPSIVEASDIKAEERENFALDDAIEMKEEEEIKQEVEEEKDEEEKEEGFVVEEEVKMEENEFEIDKLEMEENNGENEFEMDELKMEEKDGENEFEIDKLKMEENDGENDEEQPGPSSSALYPTTVSEVTRRAGVRVDTSSDLHWCVECKMPYKSETWLSIHYARMHPDQLLPYACDNCGYRSMSETARDRHQMLSLSCGKKPPVLKPGTRSVLLHPENSAEVPQPMEKATGTLEERKQWLAAEMARIRKKPNGVYNRGNGRKRLRLPYKELRRIYQKGEEGKGAIVRCPVCTIKMPHEEFDRHFEVWHEKHWYQSSTKCAMPACDYRSMIVDERRKHVTTHSPGDSNYYEIVYIDCPFCDMHAIRLPHFTSHIIHCHKLLRSSQERLHACESCGFTASQVYEMVAHWREHAGRCEAAHVFDADAVRRMKEATGKPIEEKV